MFKVQKYRQVEKEMFGPGVFSLSYIRIKPRVIVARHVTMSLSIIVTDVIGARENGILTFPGIAFRPRESSVRSQTDRSKEKRDLHSSLDRDARLLNLEYLRII